MGTVVVTHTRTHVFTTFANPYFVCDRCGHKVRSWHDPERCGCGEEGWSNQFCGHTSEITSLCVTWSPVRGCSCRGDTHKRRLEMVLHLIYVREAERGDGNTAA